MKGIRIRLTVNFMIVIIITVSILEVLLIGTVRQNYYGSLEGSLTNQIKISADLYAKYFSNTSLQENVLYNVDAFWNQSNAEVEIVDKDGAIVMDSLGVIPIGDSANSDINDALNGKMGKWVGILKGQKVMTVAYPLKSNNEVVGALRFITSLKFVDQDIQNTAYIFIAIGLLVIFVVGLLSVFLANTIIIPLKEVTKAAEEMAAGNFQARSKKTHEDEIGKLSDTLNYMADEIVKKDQLKNDFISSVSHELRTPLTSIMGWAITLQNEKFQQKEMLKDGLSIVAKESERLTHMVEELLDFSKFISGRIILQNEEINLVNLISYIHKQLTPRAVRENIDFTLQCPENLPCLNADPNRLKQLFINVLDNAFNFTPAGGRITISIETQTEGFIVTISDSGCGIRAEELPMVKEKFYKGKSSRSKNGIGLSICQEIVTLMGGKLEISSVLNQGTDVLIALPTGESSHD
ncbi:HAMP domain-containing sensor histidine kinase [Desulfosporosinus sp. PR]|uniref:sensor histidine kinase n=1 Tax=Candidatus Desulfosporosinus nitrosoreducens TaxID=3401928 RepID=UPI0027F6516E|nr:HAMP domain-containing sensor histidine kinase [Desulfosporosinus sp. PR]MDQ7093347.1 HAMP domain-containing sensor histidine kinase [Desulfosporosinus sp. PR]